MAIFDIFGQYQHVLICYTPQSFLEWCIKPKIIRTGIMHPISNVLDTIMHMVRIHMSAFTHFLMIVLVTFWHVLINIWAIVTKLTYQGIHCPYFEDAGRDESSGEA